MKKLVLFTIIFFSVLIRSQNLYYPLVDGGDKVFTNLDVGIDVKRVGNSMAWVEMARDEKTIKLKSGKFSTVDNGYTISLYEFKCKDNFNPFTKYRFSNLIVYDRSGKVLFSGDSSSYTDWMLVAPKTNADVVSQFVCEGMIYN